MMHARVNRPAAVAGLFYPSAPKTLDEQLTHLLNEAPVVTTFQAPHALVIPHAGYVYSGPTAAQAFKAIQSPPKRILLIGPAHRVYIRGMSAGDYSGYECPLGTVSVDRDALGALVSAGVAHVQLDAHAEEHCLEVMIPFIVKHLGHDVPIVPLLVGSASPSQVLDAIDTIRAPGDLIVVSSDLSHFRPYEEARERDLSTVRAILDGDVAALGPEDACGYRGIGGVMRLAAREGWSGTLIDYRNSGDTAGDRARVVGYASLGFF